MKRLTIIMSMLFLTCLTLNSCSNNEELETVKETFDLNYLKNSNSLKALDNIFDKQFTNILEYKNSSLIVFDADRFELLLGYKEITHQESIELNSMLNHLGFDNKNDFLTYSNTVAHIVTELNETNYYELSEEEQLSIWSIHYSNFALKSCGGVLDAERNSAQTFHTWSVVGCTTASIASITYAGPFAILIQSLCLAAATDHLISSLRLAGARYQSCIGN
jgi:hypothetical protein